MYIISRDLAFSKMFRSFLTIYSTNLFALGILKLKITFLCLRSTNLFSCLKNVVPILNII